MKSSETLKSQAPRNVNSVTTLNPIRRWQFNASTILTVLTVLTAFFLAGCSDNSQSSSSSPSTNTANSSGSPLTAPADYLNAIAKGKQSAEKTIDTTALDKAIQMFGVDHGRNPKDLNELVQQKYIPKIPDAPYGTKLVYDANSGTVTVQKQ
jgi:hypothetical protein